MAEIVIYNRKGTVRHRLDSFAKLCTVKSAEQKRELLGEDTVTIKTTSAQPLELVVGDYIVIYGSKYTLNKVNEPTKISERKFENTMVFEGLQYKLIDAQYRNTDAAGHNPSAEFPIVANMRLLMQLLINNVNRVATSLKEIWELGECPDTEHKEYSFSNENCLEVLQRVCKDNSLEFEIEAVTSTRFRLHIRKVGRLFPASFTFGRGGGVYKLTRKNVNSNNLVTRLYIEGSTRNITSKYRNGALRLRIGDNEGSYIENPTAVAAFGIKEGSRIYEDIYPHRTGQVTAVVADNGLQFVDNTMFDLNEKDEKGQTRWLIDGTCAKVKFVGNCNLSGYQFEVAKFDSATKTFTLNLYEDSRGLKIPDGRAYTIEKNAEYVLLDIVMPDDPYVIDAEAELKVAGEKDLAEDSQPKVEYELELSSLELKRKFGSEAGIVNLFNVGDYLPIKDADINVDKAIRIKGFTRDCYSDPYKYKVTLSDTVEVSIIQQLLEDNAEIGRIVVLNDLTNLARARANWRTTQELLGMVFDSDGYFDPTNIRPSSIETLMLSVGNRAGQFVLRNIFIEANAAVAGKPNPNYIRITSASGQLIHYAIEETDRTWAMSGIEVTLNTNAALYIYAVCPKAGGTGTFVISTTKYATEVGTNYYFPVGVLSSVYNGYREVTTTYGATRITGRCINCGRIESIDKSTYFDLDNGEIGGRIKFRSTSGELMNIAELEQQINSTNDEISGLSELLESLQDQIDGAVEYWFGTEPPTLENAPANQWVDEDTRAAHLGDMFTDTNTGLEYRYTRIGRSATVNGQVVRLWTYFWQEVPSTGVGQAIQAANNALNLAGNKNHVFVTASSANTPQSPYKEGDLWVTLNNYKFKICIKSRENTSGTRYLASEWKDAGYTDDTQANKALQQLTDLASDNIITPAEKITLKDEMANIKVDYSTVKARAQLAEIDTTAFDAAYSTLLAYTNAILTNMSVNTVVDKTTYNANFNAYYTERTNLLDAMSKGYVEGIEMGGGNFIGNGAFFQVATGWSLNVNSSAGQSGAMTILSEATMGNVLRVSKPNALSWWYFGTGMKSAGGNILLPQGKFANGVTYTVAFWVRSHMPFNMSVGIMDGTGSNVVAPLKSFAVSNQWQRVSYTFKANNLSSASSRLYITTTATFSYCYFTKFVLVEGNKAPEWNESSQEINAQITANKDLLKAITENYTQIEGGLILSTFLKLGALQQSGEWVESAGLKAMYSNRDEIAAYFGGTYAEALAGTKAGMTIIYHNGKLKAKDAEITGVINATDGTFSGKLNGVTGTFRVLQAIDNNGNVKAEISFNSSEGKLYFTGDMQHQGVKDGRSLRFLTSNLWCRGSFGTTAHNTLVVNGTGAYFYPNGLNTTTGRQYISLESAKDSGGRTYYKVPVYGTSGECAGFPVDLVIFTATSATYNYHLVSLTKGAIITLVNAQKTRTHNVYIHGAATGLAAGTMQQVVYIGAENMNPVQGSGILGAGMILGGTLVNNWSS